MNDYHATVKIQQGRIRDAMASNGIQTVAELSRLSGVCQVTIGLLLNFKIHPRIKGSKTLWKDSVMRISKTLCYTPEELFPDHLHFTGDNTWSKFIDPPFAKSITTDWMAGKHSLPIGELTDDEKRVELLRKLKDLIPKVLNERQGEIINMHYIEGRTLTEISEKFGRTRECISQNRDIAIKELYKHINEEEL